MELNRHELTIINNALNESLELLEDFEFETRMGATKQETRDLLKKVQENFDDDD